MLLFRKAPGQQRTMKTTTKTGEAVAPKTFLLNCKLSNHFKSTVTEYSLKFNGEHMKGALNAFVCRFSFFSTRVINPSFLSLPTHTCAHTHTRQSLFWKWCVLWLLYLRCGYFNNNNNDNSRENCIIARKNISHSRKINLLFLISHHLLFYNSNSLNGFEIA